MGRRVSSPTFVGRAAEILWLQQLHAEAAAGRAGIVMLGGDSGVGKTRLIAEFAAWARAAGSYVLIGSSPLIREGELPFAPITEALRGLIRETGRDDLLPIIGPSVPDLRRLLPDLARLVPSEGDGATTQARLYDAFLGVLERASSPGRPVVLVVEDLQWADRASREMVSFLAHNIASLPILLIGTYREDELRAGNPMASLLADMDRSGISDRRTLTGLPESGVAALYEAVTGTPADRLTTAGLLDRTEGNPYLLEELIASREEDGSLPASTPTNIREQVAGRIAALPTESQEVMRLAATIGRRSSHRLIALTSRYPELILLAALREAVRQHVIVPITDPGAEGYAFRQGIFQEVLYDDLLPGERQGNHRLVAEALADHPDLAWGSEAMASAELARHWLAAGDRGQALDAAVAAARAAREAFAFSEVQRHLETALQQLDRPSAPEPDRRIGFRRHLQSTVEPGELLEQAAEAASLAGDPGAAVRHGQAALDRMPKRADAGHRSRLQTRLARYLAEAGDTDAAITAHRRAIAIATEGANPEDRVRTLADLARTLQRAGRSKEAEEAGEAALEVARTANLEAEEASLLTTMAAIQAQSGRVVEGLKALDAARAIRSARGLSQVVPRPSRIGTIVRSYAEVAAVLERAGAMEASEAASRLALESARKLGASGSWGRFLESNSAAALYYLGRWDEAETAVADIVAGRDHASDGAALRATITRARIDVGRGRFGEAETRFEVARAAARGDPVILVELAVGVAELALWRRQPTEALGAVEAGRERTGSAEDPALRAMLSSFALRAAADLADHARARRSVADTQAALDEAGPWLAEIRGLAEREGRAPAAPRLLRGFPESAEAEWLRVRGEPSQTAWAAAASRWADLGEPFQEAYARWREAEASLAGRGERSAAATSARSGHGIAIALGAAPLAAEIEALARRGRLELAEAEPAAMATRPEDALGLTAREFEVLLLVADGRTNRQIAETLFITEKTAGHHVSNLLGKLGVTSRVEAAALAHRLGLLTTESPGSEA